MSKLFIAAVAFAALTTFSAPALAVNCDSYCLKKCQMNSNGSNRGTCLSVCAQRCEAWKKKH
jgi:hypothetical protein